MKTSLFVSLFVIVANVLLPASSLQASDGEIYSSYWKCSDGNMYGLAADGNKRWLYLANNRAPLFFAGEKKGNSYVGTIFLGGKRIAVSGPISKNSTRVTLYSSNGSTWVLDYSHK